MENVLKLLILTGHYKSFSSIYNCIVNDLNGLKWLNYLENGQDKKGGLVSNGPFFRTLVQIQTFFKKLVQKWSGFTSKSSDFTKYGKRKLKISNFEHKTTMQWRLFNARKVKNFSKSLISVRICWPLRSGLALNRTPDLEPCWSILVLFDIWQHLVRKTVLIFKKKRNKTGILHFLCHKISR